MSSPYFASAYLSSLRLLPQASPVEFANYSMVSKESLPFLTPASTQNALPSLLGTLLSPSPCLIEETFQALLAALFSTKPSKDRNQPSPRGTQCLVLSRLTSYVPAFLTALTTLLPSVHPRLLRPRTTSECPETDTEILHTRCH